VPNFEPCFSANEFSNAGKHAFISHQSINPPAKAGIYIWVQEQPVYRRLETSGSRSTEAVFTIYLSVYLYLLDIPIDDFTVSQLPFCNSSKTGQMVGFCVHKRAQLWLSLRAGAHSYKNKWSMMVPISSTRERFMPAGGRFTRKYKENSVSVTYQTVSTAVHPILVNARHKLHSSLTHAVFSP